MPLVSYLYSLPYIGCVLICFACYNRGCDKKTKNVTLVCLGIFFCWFLGLRGFLYTDFINYYPYFNKLAGFFSHSLIDEMIYEPGFVIYSKIIKTIFPNYHLWIFVNSLIDVVVLTLTFKRYSAYPVLSWAVFIAMMGLVMQCNLLRNFKGLDCFLLSLPYLIKRQAWKYIGLNLLGSTFHISSLIYIPCYFILTKKINKYILGGIFLFVNCLFFLKMGMSEIIMNFINDNIPGASIFQKMNWYINDSQEYGFSIGYFERTITFLLAYIYFKGLYRINSNNIIFCNCIFLYYFLFYLFSDMPVFVERIPLLFIFTYWILYPNLLKLLSSPAFKIGYSLLLLFCCFKTAYSNRTLICRYDNIMLFGIENYETRKNYYISNPEIQ